MWLDAIDRIFDWPYTKLTRARHKYIREFMWETDREFLVEFIQFKCYLSVIECVFVQWGKKMMRFGQTIHLTVYHHNLSKVNFYSFLWKILWPHIKKTNDAESLYFSHSFTFDSICSCVCEIVSYIVMYSFYKWQWFCRLVGRISTYRVSLISQYQFILKWAQTRTDRDSLDEFLIINLSYCL